MESQHISAGGGAYGERSWTDRVATLDSENINALKALVQRIRDGESAYAEETRRTLQAVSEDARQHDVRAEQLLITVKELWHSSAQNVNRASRESLGSPALDEFVSTFLDVYYGVPSRTS